MRLKVVAACAAVAAVAGVVLVPPGGAGAVGEVVLPVMYALPAESTAIELAKSPPLPPRKVEYRSVDPVGSSLATKASPQIELTQPPWRTD